MTKDFKIKTMKLKGRKFKVKVPIKEMTLDEAWKRGRKIMRKYRKTCNNCIHEVICYKRICFPKEMKKQRYCENWLEKNEHSRKSQR